MFETILSVPAETQEAAARPVWDLGHRHRLVMAQLPRLPQASSSPVRDLGVQYRLLLPDDAEWAPNVVRLRVRTLDKGFGEPVSVPAAGATVDVTVRVTAQTRESRRDENGRRHGETVRAWTDADADERARRLLAERAGLMGGDLEVGPSIKEGDRGVWFYTRRIAGFAMTVTDAELLRAALESGIGRGRGYGLGMLTTTPSR